jgi:hypothetical protein
MRRILKPVVFALLLVVLLAVGVNAQTFYTSLDDVWMNSLIVNKTATIGGATSIAGALSVTGAFNATGNSSTNGTFSATSNMSTGGKMTAGTFYVATNQGNATITEGLTFTPTGTMQGLTAAGSVSTGWMTVLGAGTQVTLINFGSNTITLTETAQLVTSGNIALGQYDNASFISDGSRWILLSTTNN